MLVKVSVAPIFVALLLPFFWAAAVLGSDAGSADVHASQVSPVPDCS